MRLRLVVALTILHTAIAVVAISPAFFYLNVGTAQRVFGGSNGESALLEDVRAYHDYASKTVQGLVPYRDFAVEYPPGAIPFFVLPRLLGSSFEAYRWLFALEMMIVNGGIIALIAGHCREPVVRRRALTWYTIAMACLGGLPIARFDLVPTALAFWAALRWHAGGTKLAGLAAGIGAMVKLFPGVVLVPGLFDRDRNWLWGTGIAVGTVVLGVAAWLAIGGEGMIRSLSYHGGRGLEIESVYAGCLIAVAKIAGWPLSHDFNHSSVELIARGASLLARIATPVQLVAIGGILVAYQRGGRRDFPRYSGACVIAFATFGKVLSPQYMIWCLPFVMILEGRRGTIARPLMVMCCGLSSLVYFWAGVGLLAFHPLAVGILMARNVGLVTLLAVVLLNRSKNRA